MPERAARTAQSKFTIGRWSENELILFLDEQQESWILYPPRSGYDFINKRRPPGQTAVVEHHPWAVFSRVEEHPVQPRDGCLLHGMDCSAHAAIQAAVDNGFDPFA
jgi:hypothetical protein